MDNTATTANDARDAVQAYLDTPSPVRATLRRLGGSKKFPRFTTGREFLTGKNARRGVPGAFGNRRL